MALALSAAACAGPGHLYGCDLDAGPCLPAPVGDAGLSGAPFVSAPVLIATGDHHNGYTDVARFAGAAYAAYRHASYRGYDGAAEVRAMRSPDKGATWQPAATLSLPGYDLRDPKLTSFRDRLLVTFTAWDVKDPTQNRAFVRAALSSDGVAFTLIDPPSLPQPFGLLAWRPRAIGSDALLLPVWTADELLNHPQLDHVSLLRSSDGQTFALAGAPPIGFGGAEPEILVQSGGRLLVTAPEQQTGATPQRQSFCRTTAPSLGTSPFDTWDCWTAQGPRIETPLLWEWQGAVLLFGRRDLGDGRKRTAVWQVIEEEHSLLALAELPSFGDTGAPGLLPLDANTALLTYYTSSAGDPRAVALGHEPTEVESIRLNLQADVVAVTLTLSSAPIGK